MGMPPERRLLQTMQARAKRHERAKTMTDNRNKFDERYLRFAEETHCKELKRIEKFNQRLTKVLETNRNYDKVTDTARWEVVKKWSSESPGHLEDHRDGSPPKSLQVCTTDCHHFPCVRPVSSRASKGAGFNTADDVDLNVYERLSRVCLDEVLLSDGPSIRRPCRSTVDQRRDQERRLRATMHRNRQKRLENQPKDWFINYGKPISKRKILNPPRPAQC